MNKSILLKLSKCEGQISEQIRYVKIGKMFKYAGLSYEQICFVEIV